jgi:hypothetical protein
LSNAAFGANGRECFAGPNIALAAIAVPFNKRGAIICTGQIMILRRFIEFRYAALIALGILAVVFSIFANNDCFALRADGAGWQTYVDYQADNRSPYSQLGVDAEQGNFDAYYPIVFEYTIPGALVRLVGGSSPGPVAMFAIYTGALFACVFLAAIFFCRSISAALLAAFLSAFFVPPLIVGLDSPTFRFIPLNPHWIQLMILSTILVAAVWFLDGKWTPSRIFAICLPAICAELEIISLGAMIIFTVASALYCIGALIFSPSKSALLQKCIAGVICIAVVVISGAASFLYSEVHYSAYYYFGDEFDWFPPISVFLTVAATYPFGTLLVIVGVIGALIAVFDRRERLRQFAMTHLVATFFFLAAVAFYYYWGWRHPYRGSQTLYFEAVYLPFAAMFCAVAINALVTQALRVVSTRIDVKWLVERGDTLAIYGLLIAVLAHNAGGWASGAVRFCTSQQFYSSMRSSDIIEKLRTEIAIGPGKPFRGNSITIDGTDAIPQFAPVFSQVDMNHLNDLRREETGNDHRLYGLWHYRIPTMYQYFTFTTAPYYLLLTEFLAPPEVLQARSELVLTRINPAMLRLWGVRFVITDQDSTAGHEVASIPLKTEKTLRLLELDNPNLGNYSPTAVHEVTNFHSGLLFMHEPDFDGSKTVITDRPIEGSLSAAANVRLTYETYGFHVQAESAGESVLILPPQFSHCWTAVGEGNPLLFRANLMQLGIKFSRKLDARLVFRYGPLFASSCRLDDIEDINRLDITRGRVFPRDPPRRLFGSTKGNEPNFADIRPSLTPLFTF